MTTNTKFTVGQEVVTRDGHPGRVICIDRKSSDGCYSMIALIHKRSHEEIHAYTSEGVYANGGRHHNDIFPKPKIYYLYVSPTGTPTTNIYSEDFLHVAQFRCDQEGGRLIKLKEAE